MRYHRLETDFQHRIKDLKQSAYNNPMHSEIYRRQLLEFTEEEQELIFKAEVGIAGCGGLGTSVATALASAGVGSFVLMDPDTPELSNLNRQFVYCGDVFSGNPRPKAEILAEWIRTVNPDARTKHYTERFSESTSHRFGNCDVIVDCLDSVGSRMDLNRYCVSANKPLVHGSIDGFSGQIMTVIPKRTPCLSCVMGDVPESESPPASIGSVVMSVGSMEATEVLKIITGSVKEITVPDKVNYLGLDYRVVSISEKAFYNCRTLISADLGNITSIGTSAFENCMKMTSVKAENVKTIGQSAFRWCSKMTSLELGDKVQDIKSAAFYNCRSPTSLDLPDSVKIIAAAAFKGCSGLTEISFGTGLSSVVNTAFSGISFYDGETKLNVNADNLRGNTFEGTGSVLYLTA